MLRNVEQEIVKDVSDNKNSSFDEKIISAEELIYTNNNNFKDSIFATGDFAVIAGATYKGKNVVVKVCKEFKELSFDSQEETQEYFLREMKMTKDLQSLPNMVKLIGATSSGIVLKRYVCTLEDRLNSSKPITEAQLLKWAEQIAEGLAAMHKNELLHTDLKAKNIYLDEEDNAVIADFGEACTMSSSPQIKAMRSSYLLPYDFVEYKQEADSTTPPFVATIRHDVYSYGLLLLAMVSQNGDPFFKLGDGAKIQKIKEEGNEYTLIPEKCPQILKELITACCRKGLRPRAQTIFEKLQKSRMESQDSIQATQTELVGEKSRLFQPPSSSSPAPVVPEVAKKLEL